MRTINESDSLLASTLFGRTRRRILGLLLGRPDGEFYVREIVRETGSALGAVQRELRALELAAILRRRRRGNQVLYRANRSCPIFPELRSIAVKTFGLVDVLRVALLPLRERIRVAFVFGSLASGSGASDSDVDLFILGEVSLAETVDRLAESQRELRREINPVVQSPEEFERRAMAANHFLTTILRRPKLFVIGDHDELDRLGAPTLVGAAHDQPGRDR